MSLTPEQVEIRKTGIGASEVAAVLGISPYQAPIDVWLRKRGHEQRAEESDAMSVGHALEDGMRKLYEARTGDRMLRVDETYRHPHFKHVLASPDGLPAAPRSEVDRGLEIKIVGDDMAHHWAGDSLPEYVLVQVVQNMAVCDTSAWDVFALLNGTEPRLVRVARDYELEEIVLNACEDFWTNFVETGDAPPVEDPAERRKYLLARYPYRSADKEKAIDDSEEVAQLARWLSTAHEYQEMLAEKIAELENIFIERIGERYGIRGEWGSALHYPVAGRSSWKDIAKELAGGEVPAALIEKHRGAPSRTFKLYPPSQAKPKSKSKGRSR